VVIWAKGAGAQLATAGHSDHEFHLHPVTWLRPGGLQLPRHPRVGSSSAGELEALGTFPPVLLQIL
jgi:hypothetical protein